MKEWHYSINGQTVGPVTEEELVDLFKSGTLALDTLVWTKEIVHWKCARDVEGLVPSEMNPRPLLGRSIGGLFLLLAVYLLSQIPLVIFYVIQTGASFSGPLEELDEFMESDAFMSALFEKILSPEGISASLILQFISVLPVIYWLSNFKGQKWTKTLGFTTIPLRSYLIWGGVLILYQFAANGIYNTVEVPEDEFTQLIAGSQHLVLAFGICFLAPIMEELIFRGYLYKAWRQTGLGAAGTIFLTSFLFALMHAGQYSMVVLPQLFVLAIIIGLARERTGSIYLPIFLHFLNNLFATIFIIYLGD